MNEQERWLNWINSLQKIDELPDKLKDYAERDITPEKIGRAHV